MPSPPSTFLKVIGVNSFTDEDEDHRNNNNNSVNVDHFHSHSFSSSMDNLKPSIIIIILILAITLLLSISLFLLLRHLNRRFLRHPSSVSSTITAPPDATSRRASSRRISPENHTFSVIDSLPLFTFSSLTRRSTTAGDCAVCLSKFEPHDQLRLLPLCCHAFHVHCIDTWLEFNQTCPLCRSPVVAMESDFVKAINESAAVAGATESFRIEIGSISSRRQGNSETGEPRQRSYSIGSYNYIVDEPSDISVYRRSASDKEDIAIDNTAAHPALDTNLASEVAAGRSWLKDYVDRLSFSVSSRAASFRSSGRFFAGSSRRSDVGGFGDYDVEASRVGEEISEMFRWLSGYE